MTQNIPLSKIVPNSGQIEGLPANPRIIKDEKFAALKKSLQDDPEMLELRELIVFPFNKEFIIIGGNMRYRAAQELGIRELPCKTMRGVKKQGKMVASRLTGAFKDDPTARAEFMQYVTSRLNG